jgi:hypothetical protein
MMKRLLLFLPLLSLVGCDAPATPPATTPSPAAKPADAPAKLWDANVSINDLDHAVKTTISPANAIKYDANLVIRCSKKRIEAYIVVPTLVGQLGEGRLKAEDGHYQTVRYRFDNQPTARQTWTISDDFEALFLPAGVITRLPRYHSLIVEYQPDYLTPETMTISLAGLKEFLPTTACPASLSLAGPKLKPAPEQAGERVQSGGFSLPVLH